MGTPSASPVVLQPQEPRFLNSIEEAYAGTKNVQIVTGDIGGLFWNESLQKYTQLDQVILARLQRQFTVVGLDVVGLSFFDSKEIAEAFVSVYVRAKMLDQADKKAPVYTSSTPLFRDSFDEPRTVSQEVPVATPEKFRERALKLISESKFDSMNALAVIREFMTAYSRVRKAGDKVNPLCVLIRHAGALFPQRDFASMDQTDRQRLVYFLNSIADPAFLESKELFLLISPSLAEVSRQISTLTNVAATEIPLPLETERYTYIQYLAQKQGDLPLAITTEEFAKATAALPLAHIGDLVATAKAKNVKVTYKDTSAAVNNILKNILRGASFKQFDHTADQVYFFDTSKQILFDILADCDHLDTATSVVGIWGPNGGGKTWLVTGIAGSSGWVVLELKGLRDSKYGESEKILEQLKLVLEPFTHIIILKDEADTDLGDVRNKDNVHDVDERLYGMINEMMTDKRYLGKIVWFLMTARPDRLGSDVRSRCASSQLAVFDLEGESRKGFIQKIFQDKGITLTEEDVVEVINKTNGCSNRDLTDGLVPRYLARKRRNESLTVVDFLKTWKPADAIGPERRMQSLIAAENCTFPELIPKWISEMSAEERTTEISRIKFQLKTQ